MMIEMNTACHLLMSCPYNHTDRHEDSIFLVVVIFAHVTGPNQTIVKNTNSCPIAEVTQNNPTLKAKCGSAKTTATLRFTELREKNGTHKAAKGVTFMKNISSTEVGVGDVSDSVTIRCCIKPTQQSNAMAAARSDSPINVPLGFPP
jgi:hypothetical protein